MHLPGYKPNAQGPSQADHGRPRASSPRPSARSSTPAAGSSSPSASDELRELALYGHIPVTTTLTGKGCFPEDHDLSMGMLGMHGTPYANYAISQARPHHRRGRALRRPGHRQAGDLRPEATLHPRRRRPGRDLQERGRRRAHRGRRQEGAGGAAGRAQEAGALARPAPALDGAGGGLEARPSPGGAGTRRTARSCPSAAVNKIWEVTRGEAIVCTEVGQHQMWAAQHYLCRHPRRFISSGGLGTMGFGFPAAIGAQVACPDAAGHRHRRRRLLPDDPPGAGHRGAVRAAGEGRASSTTSTWAWCGSGRSSSGTSATATPASSASPTSSSWPRPTAPRATGPPGPRSWRRCCGSAFASDGPAVIDIRVKREANVYPMIPAGRLRPRHDGGGDR